MNIERSRKQIDGLISVLGEHRRELIESFYRMAFADGELAAMRAATEMIARPLNEPEKDAA